MGVSINLIASLVSLFALAYMLIGLFTKKRKQRLKRGGIVLMLSFMMVFINQFIEDSARRQAEAGAAGFTSYSHYAEAQQLKLSPEDYYPFLEERKRQELERQKQKEEQERKEAAERAVKALCEPGEDDAYRYGRKGVKAQLRDPDSAEFPTLNEVTVIKQEECGQYRVDGWVRARNGFGGLNMNNFTIFVTHQGKGNWIYSPAIIN